MKRLHRLLRRFARARDGATAVEFGFVALPFIALLFATLELGMIFMVQTTLDNALEASSREIRVGISQSSGMDKAGFKTSVCNNLDWLGTSCAANLYLDVAVEDSFTNQTLCDPQATSTFGQCFDFDDGAGGSIIVVRAFYQWTVITPLLNQALVNLGGNKRLIQSTITFRNEPF